MYFEKRNMTQNEWIRHYNEQSRDPFNEELFIRSDDDIINQMKDIILSCEVDKYFTLKVLSMRVIKDYEEVYETLRRYEEEKNALKKKKYDNEYDYIPIKDSDIMLLEVKYLIRKNGVEIKMKQPDGTEKDVLNPEKVLTVLIALPRFVNKYYFRLKGNYYSAIMQIVDGSTYNNSTTANSKYDSVVLKTLLMSVRLFRMFKELVDVNTKQKIRSIIYTSIIFNNHVNVMYYLLAKYGLTITMAMFNCNFIELSYEPTNYNDYYCFKKHNIYISVPKVLFDGEAVIQSLVCTISDGITKDATIEDLYSYEYWLINLGMAFRSATVDKGLFVLDSLESIYDINTKKSLRLPDEEKKDIYHVLRWLICEFGPLRAKDNLDLGVKRIRLAEYIAHVYAMRLTNGIHRLNDDGRKVKFNKIERTISINPMYILSSIISMSNLVSYVDMVNDNDAIQVLKYTYKGISGLGETGDIQKIYRFVDASHIGILDMDASSASDPGMTGMICPMAKLYNGSFEDYQEPLTYRENFGNKLNEFYKDNGYKPAIRFDNGEPPFEYDYIKKIMEKRALDMDRVVCPIKDLDGRIDYRYDNVILPKEEINIRPLFTVIDKDKK